MFISDIHGSKYFLEKALEKYKLEKAERLVILGDILYHGPRNPLPEGHDPTGVAQLLNEMADELIAIQGNCESEVDQMVLDFPVLVKHSHLLVDSQQFFLTHGHTYHQENHPKLKAKTILCHGHTHIPVIVGVDELVIFNPGSIALPKNNTPHSYGIYEDNTLKIKPLLSEDLSEIYLSYHI